MSRTNFDDPIIDGSILSDNLTPNMKAVKAILEYCGKIAVTVSEQGATAKIEKKKGLENFLKEKIRIEKAQDGKKLTAQELIDLENRTRYEIFQSKIGNKTEIMRLLMLNICTESNPFWKKISDDLRKESADIANRVMTITKATDDNDARRYL